MTGNADSAQAGQEFSAPLRPSGARDSGSFALRLRPDRDGRSAGFAAGDVVAITAGERTVLGRLDRVWDGDTDEVFVPFLDRRLLGCCIGDDVSLRHETAEPIRHVRVLVSVDGQQQTSRRFEAALRRRLVGQPVAVARVLEVVGDSDTAGCFVRVAACEPARGVVTADTELDIAYAGELEVAGVSGYVEVGGLQDEIDILRSYLELPLKRPDLYREAGVHVPRGLILHGPPGVGKTHLARATAGELGVHAIAVGGPELVGMRYGETEAALRRLFRDAAENAPALVIIDELDALVPERGASGAQADVRVVSQVLSCLDGLIGLEGVVVLGTTNRLESIDSALRRPGRFDRELWVGPPDEPARGEILAIHTRPMPLAAATVKWLPELARRTPGYVGADLMALCREAGLVAVRRAYHDRQGPADPAEVPGTVAVETADFEHALATVQPTNGRRAGALMVPPGWDRIWGGAQLKSRLLRFGRASLEPGSPLARQGILLYGESGVGKTALAEGLAGELGANLVVLRPTDVFSKWLGESEEAIRDAFELARNLRPAVVVLDQIESFGGHDGEAAARRVKNELLTELDNPRNAGVLVIGTTGVRSDIDEGLLRAGRLGLHFDVALPDDADRLAIVRGYLDAFGLCDLDPQTLEAVVQQSNGWTGARLELLVRAAALEGDDAGAAIRPEQLAAAVRRVLDDLHAN
ncbi:AAA family ATPase [Dactylosporangium sp. NPDC051485]|uniref:AAA family ATPase n=1 Tax=Dactylosporangium sp. NPDC051485 TaxID=3154846 RepID=UPI003433D34A